MLDWAGVAIIVTIQVAMFLYLIRRLDSLSDRLSNLEARMSGLEARMSGLEVRMAGLEVRMSDLEVKMSDLEVKTAASIADLRTELLAAIAANGERIAANGERIAANGERIARLEGVIQGRRDAEEALAQAGDD